MSAVMQAAADAVEVTGELPAQERLLIPAARAFLAGLHRRYEPTRQQRLADRRQRQASIDAGALPDFRADTASIRNGDWQVAALPAALQDRRVEITGPVDPKMVINALNSGASCYMADFEDSTAPTWANLVNGQCALREAVAGTLTFRAGKGTPAVNKHHDTESCQTSTSTSSSPRRRGSKDVAFDTSTSMDSRLRGNDGIKPEPDARHYTLKPFAEQAVLLVRPRGWHLHEKHVLIDGAPMSASLFDAGLFAFHNAHALAALDRGPYFYLPKLESMEEAQLWNDVFGHVEQALALPAGQIKVTVLIETLPAAFEMDEILHALRTRIAGLNCGRWDYIFSYIKTLHGHRGHVLPERGQVTMTQPFLRAYADLLVRTCHRRGAHAMGGMAAQIPIAGDADANAAALQRVREDKLREVTAGFDGTWVAHPALIPLAREVFDTHMPSKHQHGMLREDVHVTRDDLLAPPQGDITRAGFDNNVEVCVRYLAAWLGGNGCVPIHHLMEDAATAEIARTQLWQWLHAGGESGEPLRLADGAPIDLLLFEQTLATLTSRLDEPGQLPGSSHLRTAITMLDSLTRDDELADFLTLPAYARLD